MTAPAVTWGGLHAGDVVAGADGREWTVTSVGGKQRWVAGGPVVDFKLRRPGPGEGQVVEVVTTQKLTEPAPLARRADHTDTAAAVDALLGAGLTVEVLREDTITLSDATEMLQGTADHPSGVDPVKPDPFGDPAAPPGLRRKEAPTGRYGWYRLPKPDGAGEVEYPRVSTIAGTLPDRYGLEKWGQRKVAKGMALRKDLIAKAAALDVDVDKKAFGEVVESALQAAESAAGANYGTAVHKFCERLDLGETIEGMRVPAEVVPVVQAYAAALRAARLTVLTEYSERTVVHHGRGYAGTIDRVVRAADGQLYILDLKTGKDVAEYGGLEFGVQQALYAHAEMMCTVDYAGYEPMPAVDRQKSLILHVPFTDPAATQVYALDIRKGAEAAATALIVRQMRKDAKQWLWAYSPGTPADAVRLRIGRASALDELGAAVEDAKRLGAWDADTEAYALARYDMIRVGTAADRRVLAELWEELTPAGRWTDDIAELAGRRAAELAPAGVAA